MSPLKAYRADLRALVAALDDRGVFRPGEREAWDEGIDDADDVTELLTTAEALHTAIVGREGSEEVVSEHTEARTRAFV
jgi:hypothetical protein